MQNNQPGNSLELPRLTGPELPPAPPPLVSPEIPDGFLGCWEGNPGKFDYVASSPGFVTIGAPGRIVFCYDRHSITVPVAEVAMGSADRVLDVTMHIGLGYTTLYASGIETSIYSVTPTQIHARTHLVVTVTDHFLYFIPSRKDEPSIVDAIATLINADRLLVQARHTSTFGKYRQWGTWHTDFRRAPKLDFAR